MNERPPDPPGLQNYWSGAIRTGMVFIAIQDSGMPVIPDDYCGSAMEYPGRLTVRLPVYYPFFQ